MKKIVLLVTILLISIKGFACDVCENNQPEPLKGITHGIGPTGQIDYIIITIAAIIVAVALFFSIKYLVKPKETNSNHIKNIVLNEN
jgi:formate hydrogenlyase subunit 3/multisubunit Na+/H+ antiporter MnhD subunit